MDLDEEPEPTPPRVRTRFVEGVAVHVPVDLVEPECANIFPILIRQLLNGTRYCCVQLTDQTYQSNTAIWCSLLSFLAHRRGPPPPDSSTPQGPLSRTRLIYLTTGYSCVATSYRALQCLLAKMKLPEFDQLKVTAFGHPGMMCINHKILNFPDRIVDRSDACRALVSCNRCQFKQNLSDSRIPAPELLPDIESTFGAFRKSKLCPYYGMVNRMDDADVILSTYDALKETLSGRRLPAEKLPLDKNTILVCEDEFAMERAFESYYDLIFTPELLQRTLEIVDFLQPRARALRIRRETVIDRADFSRDWKNFKTILTNMLGFIQKKIFVLSGEPKDRLRMLVRLGFREISPSACSKILEELFIVVFQTRCSYDEIVKALAVLRPVQQFFHNLINPDVANELFCQPSYPSLFRFWLDTTDNSYTATNPAVKFFGLSIKPVLAALKRRNVPVLLSFGTMVPTSFHVLDPDLLEIIPTSFAPTVSINGTSKIFSTVLSCGPAPDRIPFGGGTQERELDKYKIALGQAITAVIEAVPDNVLILFPSRFYFENCLVTWEAAGMTPLIGLDLHPGGPCVSHCDPSCDSCAQSVRLAGLNGHSVICFSRTAGLDGISLGFAAVVIVLMPYLFFEDMKIRAKEMFLNSVLPGSGKDYYHQETINAVLEAFVKSTWLNPLSEKRGRMLVILDTRMRIGDRLSRFPLKLRVSTSTLSGFEDGIRRLKAFVQDVPLWNIPVDQLVSEDVDYHISHCPYALREGISDFGKEAEAIIDLYRDDGNIDLLAAGLVALAKVEQNCWSMDLQSDMLTWLVGFQHYLGNYDHQRYWLKVIKNLVQQVITKQDSYQVLKDRITRYAPSVEMWFARGTDDTAIDDPENPALSVVGVST